MDRITIIGQGAPAIPEDFQRKLRAFDPSLYVRWNKPPRQSRRPARFVIEQCTRHFAPTVEHDHTCNRIYVMLCQEPDGSRMPLGEGVFEELRRRDVQRAGYGPEDLQRFLADSNAVCQEDRQKREAAQTEAVKHASRFNRRQLLKAVHLIQNHDVLRVHN